MLLSAMLAGPAAATVEFFAVTGVTPGDVLNIRQGPGAEEPVIGGLSPLASGIEILDRRDGWAKIHSNGRDGWVAERFLASEKTVTVVGETPPDPLICAGTEPFWSLRLEGDAAVYSTPEGEEAPAPITRRTRSANSTIVWSVSLGAGDAYRAVIAQDRLCSDGMSDNLYPLSVALTRPDGQFLSGCCRRP